MDFKKINKNFSVRCVTFRKEIEVFYGTRKYIVSHCPEFEENIVGMCMIHSDGRLRILIDREHNEIDLCGTISHECVHAALSIVSDRCGGYPTDIVGEELTCYVHDEIMTRILMEVVKK